MNRKINVVVTRRMPADVESRLAEEFNPLFNPDDHLLGADELVERCISHQADALLVSLTDRVDAATMARLPASLRAITTYSVGFNHIDIDAAKARGITVTYAPEAVTEATADVALLLLLAVARRAHEYQAQLREGRWGAWSAWDGLGTDPAGKVLGIVGMGRIGQAVARRARAFGMSIHYHQRRRLDAAQEEGAVFHDSLESLFRVSQVVSLHAPSTPQTQGMINATSLSWLPPGAILINTARGDLVNDDALIAALASHQVRGAGLDVFSGEPNFDKRYLGLKNVYLLPHIGTSTDETRRRMGDDMILNLQKVFAGTEPPWKIV